MKPVRLMLLLALAIATWYLTRLFLAANRQPLLSDPASLQRTAQPFATDAVFQLELFGSPPLEDVYEKRFVLFVFINEMVCDICLDNTLEFLETMRAEHGQHLGFVAVIHSTSNNMARNMRRLGKISYPILMERMPLEAGLTGQFNLSLVDLKKGELRLRYFPKGDNLDMLPAFKRIVQTTVDSTP